MSSLYHESRPIIPMYLAHIIAAVFVATLLFMWVSKMYLTPDMPTWALWAMLVLTMAILAVCYLPRSVIDVTEDAVTVRFSFLLKSVVPMEDIIDSRMGELANIKNYGTWNLKGVKHKNYLVVGEDYGVALKIKGKLVVVFSTQNPEEIFALVPKEAS